MDISRYTEYSSEVQPGIRVLVQVPEDREELPIQVIINAGGKTLFLSVEGFVAAVDLVARALAHAGVEITLPQAVK